MQGNRDKRLYIDLFEKSVTSNVPLQVTQDVPFPYHNQNKTPTKKWLRARGDHIIGTILLPAVLMVASFWSVDICSVIVLWVSTELGTKG